MNKNTCAFVDLQEAIEAINDIRFSPIQANPHFRNESFDPNFFRETLSRLDVTLRGIIVNDRLARTLGSLRDEIIARSVSNEQFV